MANWDIYEKRLIVNGTTKRNRDLNGLQNTLINKLPNSLSHKAVKINGVDKYIEFAKSSNSNSNNNIKIIHSLPNESFECGDLVVYENINYLVTEVDADKEVYTSGKMEVCNYTIKFQHPTTGTILSYPCITSGKTYANEESKMFTLPSNRKSILLSKNADTLTLTAGKRLYVDTRVSPTPYEIEGDIDTTSYNYGSKGLIYFIVAQSEKETLNDRPDLGICNYFEPTVTPEPPDPDVPTEIVTITSDAEDNEVKLGIDYTFSATFKNELGQDVSNVIPQYSVDNTYGGKVVLVNNGDITATVTVDEDAYDLLTKQFTLTCFDAAHGFSSSVVLTITSLF